MAAPLVESNPTTGACFITSAFFWLCGGGKAQRSGMVYKPLLAV